MINHSLPQYIFIRTCIFGLQAITPVSIIWTALRAVQFFLRPQGHLSSAVLPLDVWFATETVFYFAVQLPLRSRIQRPAKHPPLLPESGRRELFERFTEDATSSDIERRLRGWFRGANFEEIGREDVKSWLSWALFEGRVEDDDEEVNAYTTRLEDLIGKKFVQGRGAAKPIRLTLDPIHVSHRSLAWYTTIGLVDTLVCVQLLWYGFHHHRLPLRRFFGLFPPRPIALMAKDCSPAKHITYWLRPHTSRTRLPVLFIHGIGVGLYPYTDFLHDLNPKDVNLLQSNDASLSPDEDGQIGILALEIMPISFRITHSALSRSAILQEITEILSHHSYSQFVLVAHSYGTIIAAHMLRSPDLSQKISSMVLIDPVCFLLHTPSVAYNFTVRSPRKANEWQLWYFASKDWGVAHTLGRRFFWRENVLWREEVDDIDQRVTVSLAGRDLIVDTDDVGRYLSGDGTAEWKGMEWQGQGLKVLWNEDKDHAQVFEQGWMRDRLVGVVRSYTNTTGA